MLTNRVRNMASSPTFALSTKAKRLKAEGKEIIDLTIGDPDFPTPDNIVEAGFKSTREGKTHYTQIPGILELRQAIATKFKRENNVDYTTDEIVVGVGAKVPLYTAIHCLVEKGDEVMIPTPTWSSYIEQVKLAEATPITIPLHFPFKLKASDLINYISPKTKLLIINYPSNPTGAEIDRDELEKIGQLAIKDDFYILSDEIYEKILFEGEHVSIASISDDIKKRVVTINGFSKTYSMTGWRIGYAAGDREIISAMSDLQSQITSCPSSISQYAALEALNGPQETVANFVETYKQRRDAVTAKLQNSGIKQVIPSGTFYYFLSIEEFLGSKYTTSIEWAESLLMETGVAVVPGEAFEYPGWFRICLSCPVDQLEIAIDKIIKFIKQK